MLQVQMIQSCIWSFRTFRFTFLMFYSNKKRFTRLFSYLQMTACTNFWFPKFRCSKKAATITMANERQPMRNYDKLGLKNNRSRIIIHGELNLQKLIEQIKTRAATVLGNTLICSFNHFFVQKGIILTFRG